MEPIKQIKLAGTSFSVAYLLTFSSETDFLEDAIQAGHYAGMKDQKKLLKEVYRLSKKFTKPGKE